MKNLKTIKVGQPLLDLVNLCYRANQPLLLIGERGVGKSECLEQATDVMEIGYICRDLSLMEPPDLVGVFKEVEDRTTFLPPEFLPTGGRGLLVFEELNRCPRYMRSPCLQLLTARTLNDYRLPGGWLPVAAINPNKEGYEVEELDEALLGRFVCANAVPCVNEWLKWAKANGVHRKIREYVDSDPDIFSDTDPRSWTKVSRCLRADKWEVDKPWGAVMDVAISGLVGINRCVGFKSFCNKGAPNLPKVMSILGDYLRHQPKVHKMVSNGRVDLIEALVHQILLTWQNIAERDRIMGSRKMRRDLEDLIGDLPPDQGNKLGEISCQLREEQSRDRARGVVSKLKQSKASVGTPSSGHIVVIKATSDKP